MSKNKQVVITIVGAGSSYTPEIIDGIIKSNPNHLPCTELRLFDIDEKRLEIMTGLSKRMLQNVNSPIKVKSSTDRKTMLKGADFILTQIRIGGMEARYLDESIPLKFEVIGQETTGPGGMFKALRTIPVMLDIAHEIECVAPNAWLINYTNPSGIITEALLKYSKVKAIGLCSGQDGYAKRIRDKLGKPEAKVYSIGLNHLGFIVRIDYKGKDLLDEYIVSEERDKWHDIHVLLRALPISYLKYYYFHQENLEEQKRAERTRAQQIMEMEKKLFQTCADSSTNTKPEILKNRGGSGYSGIAFATIQSIINNTGEDHIVSTRNNGTLIGLPDDCAVEVTSSINADGAHPHPYGEIPLAIRGIIQTVKAYETLTIEAAIAGSRKIAIQAMLAHPLVPGYREAVGLVDKLLEAHKQYLPQFWK